VRDAVVLNAGVALALTRPDRGTGHGDFARHVRAGMDLAAITIDSGGATALLERWVAATRR
jgi:anthranilate phosphoribosyltransferase